MLAYARATAEANGIANVTFVASKSHKFVRWNRLT
jgi:hypothetical protein